MITRQRAILRLLSNENSSTTKLRLVKLAFLLRQTSVAAPASGTYEFLPYHYGPYSFTLNHDLQNLERHGWIRLLDSDVVAVRALSNEAGKLDPAFSAEIDGLVSHYRPDSTDALIRKIYTQYPWFTAQARNQSRRSVPLPTAGPAVYTVGYEGLMLDGLLDLLLQSGIKRLVDVRCNPVARRFGFHKSTLARHAGDVGISYLHIPELGVPSVRRQSLDSMTAYRDLFRYYEEQILPANERSLEVVINLLSEIPTAFMCMEADANCCHRSSLARELAGRTGLPLRELRCL